MLKWNYLALICFNLRWVRYIYNLFASFEDLNLSTSVSTHQTHTERDALVGTDKNLDLTSHYILLKPQQKAHLQEIQQGATLMLRPLEPTKEHYIWYGNVSTQVCVHVWPGVDHICKRASMQQGLHHMYLPAHAIRLVSVFNVKHTDRL